MKCMDVKKYLKDDLSLSSLPQRLSTSMIMSARHEDRPAGNPGYLPRGGACVSCRRRKMRCDGKQPICSQCDRASRAEDCEYTTGQERSKVQILEDNISRLEARIQELQSPQARAYRGFQNPHASATRANMRLHQPYNSSGSTVQDLPRHIAENLLDYFLPFASEFGFFLNIPRFKASMFQAFPPGHPSRPSPALIFSTYLFAIRISNDPLLKPNETAYLTRATQEAATALSGNHPHKVMHSIQTEVLLATYFFSNGRFFEGKYHVANAVSTAISAGLHHLRSSNSTSSVTLPPHRDMIEEGERIICAWNVFNLDKCWAIALDDSPNFEHATHALAAKIDTPWPLDMDEFEQGLLPLNARTALTVQNFLGDIQTVDIGLSTRAIEAKAVVLWDRATALSRKCPDPQLATQLQLNELYQEFTSINTIIDRLKASIPPPEQIPLFNAEKARRLAVGYSIINLAVIRLHHPFSTRSDTSRRKRLAAAQVIMNIITYLKPEQPSQINPIMGTVWNEAAQVVFDEMMIIRSSYSSSFLDGSSGGADAALFSTVYQALLSMNDFCISLPLLSFQVDKIQEACRAF